jgi:hypothetical protein
VGEARRRRRRRRRGRGLWNEDTIEGSKSTFPYKSSFL